MPTHQRSPIEWDILILSITVPSYSVNLVSNASDIHYADQLEDIQSVCNTITMAKLEPAQNLDSTSTNECNQEYSHALLQKCLLLMFRVCVLMMFMRIKEEKIITLLKCLQPHRECPFNNRSRYAAGDIPTDFTSHSNHDLHEFDYWAVLPVEKILSI